MPTPLGHALAGLAVYAASQNENPLALNKESAGWAALAIAASLAPDLDFIHISGQGLTVSGMWHHGVTHSIGFALAAGAAVAFWARVRGRRDSLKIFGVVAGAWALHVLADLLNVDHYPENGIGLPALWPFSDKFYILPVLPGVNRAAPFTAASLEALAIETALFGALALAALAWRTKKAARGL
ncbi:MAG: metal-dependent hydrolase [Candidatus Nitrospinota bacterium M3_3B_026]